MRRQERKTATMSASKSLASLALVPLCLAFTAGCVAESIDQVPEDESMVATDDGFAESTAEAAEAFHCGGYGGYHGYYGGFHGYAGYGFPGYGFHGYGGYGW